MIRLLAAMQVGFGPPRCAQFWLRRFIAAMAPPRPATPTKRAAAAASNPAFSPSTGKVGGKRVSLGGDGPGAGAALS